MFIKRDKSDEMFYREFLSESKPLQEIVKEGKARHYAYEDISQDIYTMLYEPTPTDEIAPTPLGLRIAKQNLDKIKELREYQELHRLTAMDAMAAGFATQAMGKQFISLLPKAPENPEELRDKAACAEELGYGDRAAQLNAQAQAVEDYLARVDPRIMDDEAVRQKMRDTVQGALKETRDALDGMSAFGMGDEPGRLKQQGLKEKMELARLLSNSAKLKEIARLAGRFITIAKKKQREKMVSNTVSSVQMGDNLARMLPSELGKLANPALQGLFYKSYTEKTLLEYRLHGKVPQGQGPIVYIMDGSGSMQGYPEISCKAIGMALAEVARHEKRDFIMAQFGSAHEYREIQILANGMVVVDDGNAGKSAQAYSPLYLMAELEFFFNGGTNFQRPLAEAIKHISESKFKRADIIFATDGCAELSPEFVEEYRRVKAEKSFACIGILIGPEANVLQGFCDEMFSVSDLLSDEAGNEALHDKIFKI